MNKDSDLRQLMSMPLIVAALGYFVDIYDLLLFSIVRIPSLKALHVPDDRLLPDGIYLINVQMVGLLIGGILWGIIGDKKGRLSVLFGSILLYSLSNIANGFITNLSQYVVLRFVAGIGLAGELGAGITLVAEILPKHLRGYGTSIVASIGLMGAVLAYLVANLFDWKIAYIIGGGLGILLLLLRFNVFESVMFKNAKEQSVSRGNFLSLFSSRYKCLKYVRCILIGLPIWFVIGILITFSPEFGKSLGLSVPIEAGKAVMFNYIGLSLGDLSSGILSQRLQSRKSVVLVFIALTTVLGIVYLYFMPNSVWFFYTVCLLLGFAIGYWALFVTIAAEQFGTNLRATVATTVPNFVRGSINIMTPIFLLFKTDFGTMGSAAMVGFVAVLLSLLGLWRMEETYHKDLNYNE
ncbi:MFS transporter [Mucilaginibacter sp. CSA2-8R]|uniref:MFS transporter n=1 Tax=Mucilaginibacter sp. CSA2-8R TaxID=3141542 RepID=UPI00315CCE9D